MAMQHVSIATNDDYQLPLEVFSAQQPRAHILMLPALGIQAKLYRKLGEQLAAAGYTAVLMEQRGHGRSALRPSRHCDYGFKAWLQSDIPAALGWMQQQHPGVPLYLAGHSLGGHISLMARTLHPEVVGIILFATATPWYQCYQGASRLQVRFLTVIIPPLCALLGYYPGERVGFGGREARGVMADWLQMARHNRYSAAGIDGDIEAMVQADDCPVLAIYCDDDAFGPLAAIQGVTNRLGNRDIQWQEISSAALGIKADHVSWAKRPAIAVAAISTWIDQQKTIKQE
jgi:predicted alpha/beta hydrolase